MPVRASVFVGAYWRAGVDGVADPGPQQAEPLVVDRSPGELVDFDIKKVAEPQNPDVSDS